MSESPFPSSDPGPDAAAEAEPSGRRRTVLLAGGALSAAVLGAGAFFLLGGSDAAETETAVPSRGSVAAAPAPSGSPAALPPASQIELGRNPFKALYVQPAAAPPAAPAVTTPTTPSTGPGANGPTTGGTIVVPPQVPSGGGAVPAPAAPAPAPVPAKQELRLVSATHDGETHVGVFTVNGVRSTVKVDETFGPGKHLLLVSLQQGPADDQWTAVVQLGDGDPFDVVTGNPVFVQ